MTWLSLPLGLLSWLIPILFRKRKSAAVTPVSFGLCGLALLNVLWELFQRTVSGDFAALMDITPALTFCSVALVIGTILLNLWLHFPNGFLQHLEKPVRFFLVLLATTAVQTLLYIPGFLLTACIGDRNKMVGMAVGIAIALLAYAGSIPLLFFYQKKLGKTKPSWGLPLGILASQWSWNVLFSLTCDHLLAKNTIPYEMNDAQTSFLGYYLLPMLIAAVCLVIANKWELRKQRPSEPPTASRWVRRLTPFWGALLLQTLYFFGVAICAAYFAGHMTGYRFGIRSGLLGLLLAATLLILYRIKQKDQELPLHVSGAVLVFPAVELLLFYLPMILPGNVQLPYEYGLDFLKALLFCYYLPTLLLSLLILHIGPILLDNLRTWSQQRKAAGKPRIPVFVSVLLLQTAAFLLPAVCILFSERDPDSLVQLLYFTLMLGVAILLLALYLNKTSAVKLSFGVPLAVAVFPLLYELIMTQIIFRFSGLLFAADTSSFKMIYYFPVLLMTATGIGVLKLQARLRKKKDNQKGE